MQWNSISLEELAYAFDDLCEDAWKGSESHDQGPILETSPVEIKSQALPVTPVGGYVMVGIAHSPSQMLSYVLCSLHLELLLHHRQVQLRQIQNASICWEYFFGTRKNLK